MMIMDRRGVEMVAVVMMMVLVLLCAVDAAASALAAGGEGMISGGVRMRTGTGAAAGRQLSENDDPCGGFCDELGRNCVVAKSGRAFCVDCAGLLKPSSSDTGSFVECCKYDVSRMRCVTALKKIRPGICLRSEDLFVQASDPLPFTFRNDSGYACRKKLDFLDNGLACRMRRGNAGVLKCINADGTAEQPECGTNFVQIGGDIVGQNDRDTGRFGEAVAMSADGTRVAIGDTWHNGDGGNYRGHVLVFERKGSGKWVPVGKGIEGESEGGFFGQSIAMSADGNRLAIGAPWLEGEYLSMGQVRVFELKGSERWVQVGQNIDGKSEGDVFGFSVAMSADGSRVAVGAPANEHHLGPIRSGKVLVFEMKGSDKWVQVGQEIDGESEGDESGHAVAMSADGSRVVIGAPANKGRNGPYSGHARVFEMKGSERWVQVSQDIDGEAEHDELGRSVAISADGSRVAIGAFSRPVNGYVKILELQESERWIQVGQNIEGDFDLPRKEAGWSVAMSADGTRLVIGDPYNEEYRASGQVRIYEVQGSKRWAQVSQDINGEFSGHRVGWAVAMSADGSRVAFGGSGTPNGGDARVYKEVRQC